MLRYMVSISLLVAFFLILGFSGAHASFPEIQQLKSLYLETTLVKANAPAAVIVVPDNSFLNTQADRLATRIQALTGTRLEILTDQTSPEEILKSRHVITLGNMATNRFIERLYRQWQVILDLVYPGKGGYVVRSLHNPYGTGHNVIFIGGSDDSGIEEANSTFIALLGALNTDTLSVGRLMEIRLGNGVSLPSIGSFMSNWNVYGWNDSWRKTSSGREAGYPPATYFGWNPISIAGVLYYMTGKKEYLDCFKQLAMPDSGNIPLPNRTDDAFNDPLDPLVKTYHYRAHLVPLVYDLIEESPYFTDQERLFITNKLREQQVLYDSTDSYTVANGDRHALWQLMTIYSGSRYFATYYPDPAWNRRIENVRLSFRSLINNPTWGVRDTLYWVSTGIEPVFEFFLLDGFDEFVQSGTARALMMSLAILMTGDEIDNYNWFIPLALLHKAAHMTGDKGYVWMREQLGFDLSQFRIGQSYWPPYTGETARPDGLVNSINVSPLAHADWKESQSPVPEKDCFQVLSYRTGLGINDDYLLVDGFEGKGLHSYELNTISRLRMFSGKNILNGVSNGLSVWHNGMVDGMVARSAALKNSFATAEFAFVRTEVPDMPSSRWQRNILTLKDSAAIVIDQVVALRGGSFNVVRSWQPGSRITANDGSSRRVTLANGVVVTSAESAYESSAAGVIRESIFRSLADGEAVILGALFSLDAKPTAIKPVPGGYLITGATSAFVAVNSATGNETVFRGDFMYLDQKMLLLVEGTGLEVGGKALVSSDRPVSIFWDFQSGEMRVVSKAAARITLATAQVAAVRDVPAGDTRLSGVAPSGDATSLVGDCMQRLATAVFTADLALAAAQPQVNWLPGWEVDLKGKPTMLSADPTGTDDSLWVVSQGSDKADIVHFDVSGHELVRISRPGELLSFWRPRNDSQAKAFGLLAGFKNDILYAFSSDGHELWQRKAEISPEFRIGDRYDAPWFTDPAVISGVSSILAGEFGNNGEQEIIIGRPCTVEFRTLSGDLTGRVPTRWGTNSALAFLQTPGFFNFGKVLLTGKGYAGNPSISVVSREHSNISDGYFAGLFPGFANMHSWLQRGLGQMVVADLENTGTEQVVFTLSGHWNELRVYDGYNNSPRWMKSFGPDRVGGGFMRGLHAADLDGSGKKNILVATKPGWVFAFDYQGTSLWQHRFDSEITVMTVSESQHRIAVGCTDGSIFLLNGTGTIVAVGSMRAPVQSLVFGKSSVYAGSSTGFLRSYSVTTLQQ